MFQKISQGGGGGLTIVNLLDTPVTLPKNTAANTKIPLNDNARNYELLYVYFYNSMHDRVAIQILDAKSSSVHLSRLSLVGENIPYTTVYDDYLNINDWAEANCQVIKVIGFK